MQGIQHLTIIMLTDSTCDSVTFCGGNREEKCWLDSFFDGTSDSFGSQQWSCEAGGHLKKPG